MARLAFLQAGGSGLAGEIDQLFWAITAITVVFTVIIFVGIIFFSVRYRRGAIVDRSHPPMHSTAMEVGWTLLPLAIVMGIFVWSAGVYFRLVRVPKGAMEIHVVGKQWMWKLQQPTGRWEMNELHVPAGRPIQLTMTSEDVIHAFFIPKFRVKQDVIPGQFTRMWFTPTEPGVYHLFCAEFCGTLHSNMIGTVYVMEPAAYEKWLTEGDVREAVAVQGERLFRRHGCSGCHSPNASVRAPLLEGVFNRSVPVQIARPGVPLEQINATTVVADTRYLHDAIVLPEKEIRAGYRPIMPSFKNRLTEEEIFTIIAYIRSLGDRTGGQGSAPGQGQGQGTQQLSPEDYRARTGFTPDNVGRLTGPGGAGAGQGGNAGTRPGNMNGRTAPGGTSGAGTGSTGP